jgi:hypothetical protein
MATVISYRHSRELVGTPRRDRRWLQERHLAPPADEYRPHMLIFEASAGSESWPHPLRPAELQAAAKGIAGWGQLSAARLPEIRGWGHCSLPSGARTRPQSHGVTADVVPFTVDGLILVQHALPRPQPAPPAATTPGTMVPWRRCYGHDRRQLGARSNSRQAGRALGGPS